MLLFLSILGFFLSLILLYFNARKNMSTVYLGAFFLLVSLYGFYQYVLIYSKSVALIEILLAGLAIVIPPLYLIGPMLYWYIRSVLKDDSRLKRKDLWHLLPMIIYFLAALPYTFVSFSDKAEAAIEAVKDVAYIQTYNATVLDQIFPVAAIYLSRSILIFVYTLWSVGLLFRFSMQRKVSKVFTGQYFMTKWLCMLLTFLLILEITQISLIIKAFEMHFSDLYFTLNVLRIFSAMGLIGLIISPFFFPAILYGLPRVPESINPKNPGEDKANPLPAKTNTYTLNFEFDYILFINQKADSCMKENQPYLHPDFNLAQLSVQIHIPIHHLSYYFREERKQHFNDYINEWRINYAKTLLKEGKAAEFTLEAIGLKCGFPNRNSFSATFHKVEGISPRAFVSQIKN
jgi:AraC-like DNA-binding protein